MVMSVSSHLLTFMLVMRCWVNEQPICRIGFFKVFIEKIHKLKKF